MKNKLDSAGFEKEYPNVVRTAQEVERAIRDNGCHVIIRKRVKSGARMLIEALAVRNRGTSAGKRIKHIYLTKLNRRDINEQLVEMEEYDIKTFKIQNEKNLQPLFDYVNKTLKTGCLVWVHLDESDYGTAMRQLLSRFFHAYYPDEDRVFFIDYSATNEEAILSDFNNPDSTAEIALEVGEHFREEGWHLDNGAKEAEPFWDFEKGQITQQGQECVDFFLESAKFISVLRLASKYREACNSKNFRKFFEEKGILIRFVDKDNKFTWGSKGEHGEWGDWKIYVHEKQKVLLIINQTCTRSTEVGFHEHIAFWHDYRNGDGTPYNTRVQAYGRCNHYHPVGHEIIMYAHLPTLKLAAGRMTMEEYIKTGAKISERVEHLTVKRKYQREFFVENDPIFKTIELSASGVPLVTFSDGRKVPPPYENVGDEVWRSTLVSRWNGTQQNRDPLLSIINGTLRHDIQPLYCIDGWPTGTSLKARFLDWLRKENILANDGQAVYEALVSGKRVYYHAKPLLHPVIETAKSPVANEKSMFQNKNKIAAKKSPKSKKGT